MGLIANTNLQLRKAYYDTLKPYISEPIYWLFVPQGFPDLYMVITAIEANEGEGSKCGSTIEASLTITIFSRELYNDGMKVDELADRFFAHVWQVAGTQRIELVSDSVRGDFDATNQMQIVERTFILKHTIEF